MYWNRHSDIVTKFLHMFDSPVVRIFFLSVNADLTRFGLFLFFTDYFAFFFNPLFTFFSSVSVKSQEINPQFLVSHHVLEESKTIRLSWIKMDKRIG